jgi:hypothetical protein
MENMIIGAEVRTLLRWEIMHRAMWVTGLGVSLEGDLDAAVIGGLLPFGLHTFPFGSIQNLGIMIEPVLYLRNISGAINAGIGATLGFVYYF